LLSNQEEQDELCHIVETEIEKFKKEENRIKSYITENAAEVGIIYQIFGGQTSF